MKNTEVSVILPVKDEPKLISTLLNLKDAIEPYNYEIIVVTGDTARKELPKLPTKIKHYKSYGDSLQRSILLGFSVAKGEKVIVMDADGSHPPSAVPSLIETLNDYEMVVGSRFVNGSNFQTTPFRRLVTYFYNEYAKLMGSTLEDPMSGFFGVRSEVLKKLKFRPCTWKTCYEINKKAQPTTKELPIKFDAVMGKGRGKIGEFKLGMRIIYDITSEALS